MRLRQFVFVVVAVVSSVVFKGVNAADLSIGSRGKALGFYSQQQNIGENHPARGFKYNSNIVEYLPANLVSAISLGSSIFHSSCRAVVVSLRRFFSVLPRVLWVVFLVGVVITSTSLRRDFY